MIKLLFLPHCLKKDYLQKLKKEGEKRNYKIHVVGGGSAVKKILKKYQKIDKIVGVACGDEIKLAADYTKNLKNKGTKTKAIKLSKSGCKNTKVNIKEVVTALN